MSDQTSYPLTPQPRQYGPISAGEMFERTAALLRGNFKLFFGIVLVVIAVELVVGGVTGGGSVWMGRSAPKVSPVSKFLFLAPLYLLSGLLTYVFSQVVHGALFLAARARLADAPMKVGEAWRLAAEKGGRLIGISVLVGLRIAGYNVLFCLVLVIPLVPILLVSGMAHAGGGSLHLGHGATPVLLGLTAIFVLVSVVFYVVAMFWLATRYALSIPAGLAEDISITEAIRRSVHLPRGSRGRLIALYIGIACAYLAIGAFVFPVQMLTAHSAVLHGSRPSVGFQAVNILVMIFWDVWGALVIAFIGVATTLCYYDLRVRKEGFGGAAEISAWEFPSASPGAAVDWPVKDLPIS